MKCRKNKENCGGPLTPATISQKSKMFVCYDCSDLFRSLVRKGNKAAVKINKEIKEFNRKKKG